MLGDSDTITKMLKDDPTLVHAQDITSGYTALHWAAKIGNMDLIKLLAEDYKSNVNAKTNGGYTPLHISCQFGHQDIFNVLIRMYRADHSIRDNSGKTARQYFLSDWNLKARTKRNNAMLVGTTKALIKFKRQISK